MPAIVLLKSARIFGGPYTNTHVCFTVHSRLISRNTNGIPDRPHFVLQPLLLLFTVEGTNWALHVTALERRRLILMFVSHRVVWRVTKTRTCA